jgi:Putative adhesin
MASWTITEPHRLDLDEPVHGLDVVMFGGRLNVVGTDGPPRVEVGAAGPVPIQVTLVDGRLTIRMDKPRTWPGPLTPLWWWLFGRRMMIAQVSVAVPYDIRAVLQVLSGPVVVSSMRGELAVECTSGRVALLGVHGRTQATVVSGPIEALGCAGELRLETVSGEITLADSAANRLTARTISGSLTADLDNPPYDSQLALETVSGEITVRVRADSDLDVQLSATHGRVTSDFPDLASSARWAGTMSGRLGAGTGRLVANAISGNIALLRRPVDESFDS